MSAPKPELPVTPKVLRLARRHRRLVPSDTRLRRRPRPRLHGALAGRRRGTPYVAIQVVGQLLGAWTGSLRGSLSGSCSSRSSASRSPPARGCLIARATLRPLRELSETAERVKRHGRPDPADRGSRHRRDRARWPATFNAMLASLDEAAQRQRQLVQDASHELRTPLTSLRTKFEVLATVERASRRRSGLSSCAT